jgi:signal transduction histidine kinase
MTPPDNPSLQICGDRMAEMLAVLERMAAGDTSLRLTISDRRDELDALAHGINVLVGELGWATAQAVDAHKERASLAEQANASKNIFFRNMSHEIRTPITAMLGFADLLASDELAHHNRPELLRRLQANAQAVLALLDDLLDLAKLDADRIVLNPEPVSVLELVHDVFATLEMEGRGKSLDMRVEATHGTLGTIRTDRHRLRQILINLVANAVKFTGAGRIVVKLSIDREARDAPDIHDEPWTIDVTDTGIGIPEDRQPYLFEPFEQVSDAVVQVYGGNGLGLALSRRLAQQLGGSLRLLRSAPNEGTTFRLILRPLPEPQKADSALPDDDARSAERLVEGLRILLAEDHRDLHFAMRQMLEQLGVSVESAYDGRDAVAKALSSDFDAVLMDLRMPGMDGLHATRELRRQGYAVPIVALTADPATVRRAEALDAGCDACFSKPFNLEDVLAAIRRPRTSEV